jgi:alpha-glucosidase (family GH31 glycosyl hydrolase)
MIPSHLIPVFAPQPDPEAVVMVPNLRVTVLTPKLLRIEYSPDDQFEDRPSQAFWYRDHAVPEFTQKIIQIKKGRKKTEILQITTQDLILEYSLQQTLSPETLSIHINKIDHTWRFGDLDQGNLKGTFRTLDETSGKVSLEKGLLSKDGWVVVDDSNSLVFNDQGWLEPRNASKDTLDFYFFGYGHEYQECLRDYRTLTGEVPLLPRWVLGNWWSRYWDYAQEDIVNLIEEFQNHQVPLSVFILDMDWHITNTGNQSSGWTGYTWNKELFPDPKALIDHIHQAGLKTALNLHPAAGIHPHEEQYKDFAQFMDLDPAAKRPIPFDLADPKFTQAYFEILHHPQEEAGVDFWWIDWQQGDFTSLPGLDPLWWLNHLHFFDLARPPKKTNPGKPTQRSFIFSRWGGLGNHRYPIGFSGDTIVAWESLAYQPYFTATAANVCYGWWSHDIGGHMSGIEDPELYTRWVQFGVFSPILRLHSTKNRFHERRPYAYNAEISRITTQALQLRHAFIPYLYTMAWQDHKEGLTPFRSIYHLAPESEPAYHNPDEYTFGSELVAAPFTTPMDQDTRLSRKQVWLPEGDWFNFFSGEHLSGGTHSIYGRMQDIPVFAKAGAIIPLAPLPTWGGIDNPSHLRIHVFPGANNQFDLYEDDGHSTAYREGEYAITPFTLNWTDQKLTLNIGPAEGSLNLCPYLRTYELKFWGVAAPEKLLLEINGSLRPCAPEYNANTNTITLPIEAELSPTDTIKVTLTSKESSLITRRNYTLETCQKLLENFHLETYTKAGIFDNLPEIIQNPAGLARWQPTLTDTQLRAMLETITRTGVDRVNHTGDDHILLWGHNPIQDKFPITYQLGVNQIHGGFYDHPYHYEEAPVPQFLAIHPPSQFGNNSWELKVHYGNILTVRLGSDSHEINS